MPLTKTEQKRFEEMLNKPMAEKSTVEFLNQLGDVLFEFTGNVNMKMRLFNLARRISRCRLRSGAGQLQWPKPMTERLSRISTNLLSRISKR